MSENACCGREVLLAAADPSSSPPPRLEFSGALPAPLRPPSVPDTFTCIRVVHVLLKRSESLAACSAFQRLRKENIYYSFGNPASHTAMGRAVAALLEPAPSGPCVGREPMAPTTAQSCAPNELPDRHDRGRMRLAVQHRDCRGAFAPRPKSVHWSPLR